MASNDYSSSIDVSTFDHCNVIITFFKEKKPLLYIYRERKIVICIGVYI